MVVSDLSLDTKSLTDLTTKVSLLLFPVKKLNNKYLNFTGRQSDKLGNTANWWTPETLANYLTRAQCFIDQYSNYTVPSGSHVS